MAEPENSYQPGPYWHRTRSPLKKTRAELVVIGVMATVGAGAISGAAVVHSEAHSLGQEASAYLADGSRRFEARASYAIEAISEKDDANDSAIALLGLGLTAGTLAISVATRGHHLGHDNGRGL